MNVLVNGERIELGQPCSVRRLLEERGLGKSACAVEVNEVLVPRKQHQEHVLAAGDRVEIVTLVGGG